MVSLADRARRIEAKSKPMRAALQRWFAQNARVIVEAEMDRALKGKSSKDLALRHAIKKISVEDMERDLRRIFEIYGTKALEDGGVKGGTFIRDYMDAKVPLIQGIISGTRDAVREQIGTIIADALGEDTIPSPGEIARRIRTTMIGTGGGKITGATEIGTTTGGTKEVSTTGGHLYVFSSERAATIARTEIAQAENTGIFAGYAETGVEEIEWLSYRGPYPSGAKRGPFDRHHDKMNGMRAKPGEYFTTPLGNKLRYPADPDGPIGETINCRCTIRAVI